MTDAVEKFLELANRNSLLEHELSLASRAKEELAVATVIIRIAHDILASNTPDAVERAKEGLAAFLEDQRLNGR
jgi:hypothetical protein